jgi:hypothetical protein
MPVRSLLALLPLLALLGVAGARAEAPDEHAGKRQQTVYIGNERVAPSTVSLGQDDAISWVNESVHPMQITFTAPADIEKKIRCAVLEMPAKQRPPWGVFDMRNGRLVGVLPPGRFASMCELSPGEYDYVVQRLDADAGAGGTPGTNPLPMKGSITVK